MPKPKTLSVRLTPRQARWLTDAIGEVRMATIQGTERAQIVHALYWKLDHAICGEADAAVTCVADEIIVDLTQVSGLG